jgi:hypothetical protein
MVCLPQPPQQLYRRQDHRRGYPPLVGLGPSAFSAFESRGPQRLKGLPEEVDVYRVT